jgi:uncharacterized heparinase superfamily protein
MVGPETVRMLGQERRIGSPRAWSDPTADKLWLYNLHYFDDLGADEAATRASWRHAFLKRWVAENPAGGGVGWEPYPLSLRIVNWCKWAFAGNELPADCVESVAIQARCLAQQIEHHIQGNHLIANAKALLFAAAMFDGGEAARWRHRGGRLLRQQLREQVLPDGGHYERSPMYQAIILEDILDVLQLARLQQGIVAPGVAGDLRSVAGRMLGWLGAMCHPDGEISFFNDAAFGVAARHAELERYAESLGVTAEWGPGTTVGQHGVWLRDTGYVRLCSARMVAILDIAPIGPDHLPAHAHADTLSFELSVDGQRVVVNGGTSCYGTGPERLRQRGTAAHSTVEIDGRNSSEVWGGFRVGRRARIMPPIDVQLDGITGRVSAAHTGYRSWGGGAIHRRSWALAAERLEIIDDIAGRFGSAVARFHLHPDVTAMQDQETAGRKAFLLMAAGRRRLRWDGSGHAVQLAKATWHPAFGVGIPSTMIEQRLGAGDSGRVVSSMELEPLDRP